MRHVVECVQVQQPDNQMQIRIIRPPPPIGALGTLSSAAYEISLVSSSIKINVADPDLHLRDLLDPKIC